MIYLGIDPGKTGGIAILDGATVTAIAMPDTERDILSVLDGLATAACAVIERVFSSPQMGVVSAFTFGKGYGALLMALTAAEIRFTPVVPRVWQQAMGCPSRGNKNVTKQRAQQLFPTMKITHATADALLLAEYARRVAWAPPDRRTV